MRSQSVLLEKDLAKMIVNKVFFWTDFREQSLQAEALEENSKVTLAERLIMSLLLKSIKML